MTVNDLIKQLETHRDQHDRGDLPVVLTVGGPRLLTPVVVAGEDVAQQGRDANAVRLFVHPLV